MASQVPPHSSYSKSDLTYYLLPIVSIFSNLSSVRAIDLGF